MPLCRQHQRVAEAHNIQEDEDAGEAEVEVDEAEVLILAFATDVLK